MKRAYCITVGEKKFEVELLNRSDSAVSFLINGERYHVTAEPVFEKAHANESLPRLATTKSSGIIEIKAPMPGFIVQLLVGEGDTVKSGSPLAVLEAMKMQNPVNAPHDGIISKVHVTQGAEVKGGAILFTLKVS